MHNHGRWAHEHILESLMAGPLRHKEVGLCTITHTTLSLRFALYTESQFMSGDVALRSRTKYTQVKDDHLLHPSLHIWIGEPICARTSRATHGVNITQVHTWTQAHTLWSITAPLIHCKEYGVRLLECVHCCVKCHQSMPLHQIKIWILLVFQVPSHG